MHATHKTTPTYAAISPLIVGDRLLTLAADADCAGLRGTAERPLNLAHNVRSRLALKGKPEAHVPMITQRPCRD